MTSVGIREAKMHFSRLLRQVQEGEEIVITDHGRPVGKISRIRSRRGSLADLERDLEMRGIIEKRAALKPLPRPAKVPAGSAQRFLQEDRDG